MPLNMLFRLLGLILVVLGLINVAIGFVPAAMTAKIPPQLLLVEGFAQSVSLLGLGAMIYLLAEIAAKRPAKSY
ncbi:hypothetical protein [Phenylobacterium sp.]|uniref:hypothetical protein n=1 Tax=Phenylobacterium sp. TaxID=1871053 RepID=UPI00271DDDC8|nr:hypothetical protein [Phenylobacterium sp.]MDO8378262.1 hypothetical protein [Phenylobacterium sp.]